MLPFIFLTASSFFSTASAEVNPLQARARALLPKPMQELIVGKTTPANARKLLGKANLVEGQNYYWAWDGLEYSLELHFSSDQTVLQSFDFFFVKNKPKIADFKGTLKESELKLIAQPKQNNELGAKAYESSSLVLEFDPRLNLLRRVVFK